MAAGNIGTITRISGPVVDIQFPEEVGADFDRIRGV